MKEPKKPTRLDKILMWTPILWFGDGSAEKVCRHNLYMENNGNILEEVLTQESRREAVSIRCIVYGYLFMGIIIYGSIIS